MLFCPSGAKRTQRSGVFELRYLARDDREYCEARFARERLTPDAYNTSACRAELLGRLERCALSCDTCRAVCTSPAARGLVSTWKCGAGFPGLGILQAFHESDIGQDIHYRWGAIRTEGRPKIPEDSFQEQYRTLIQQHDIGAPIAPRNSISCRRPHRESTYGAYTPPLKEDGSPIQRKGFMVPCETDTDCYSRCGEHPITGRSYRCTHNLSLYTFAGVGVPDLNDENVAAGYRAYRDFPDSEFYTIDYPGDDRFDVENHSKGVCTDHNIAYGTTGCLSIGSARGTVAVEGCSGRFFGWGRKYCGALIENDNPDYVSGVGISETSLHYPRVLVPSARVNGKEQLEVTCSSEDDCVLKCETFDRIARDGGYPSPAACAMCKPPCPDNGATTFVWGFQAFFNDFAKAMRLAANCGLTLGLGTACLCEIWMLMKPAWMVNLEGPVNTCSGGDVFQVIALRIADFFIRGIESILNKFIIASINQVIGWTGHELDDICIEDDTIKKYCPNEAELMDGWLGCDVNGNGPDHEKCYYLRQRAICMTDGDRYARYKALFEQDSAGELHEQFKSIAGDAYEDVPPTMLAAFKGASAQAEAAVSHSTGLPLKEEQVAKVCDSTLTDALTLDELIQVCIFAFVENYCPGGHSDLEDGDFQTFLRQVDWQLPDVISDWKATPPPPPPATTSAYADLVESDPEGVELVREALLEFWPKMSYVFAQTQGANVGRERSADGRGYGPIYYVSRYMASTAFLATEGFEDKDSLAARMVQARFTGHFRFACRAFVDWMDDPANAGAGSLAANGSQARNPADYTSRFDRNALAIAAVLFSESHLKETNVVWPPDVHRFWDENCVVMRGPGARLRPCSARVSHAPRRSAGAEPPPLGRARRDARPRPGRLRREGARGFRASRARCGC